MTQATTPVFSPHVPLPTRSEPIQPQWHTGLIGNPAALEEFNRARDGSINAFLTMAILDRRLRGTPLANETLYSPLDRDGRVTTPYGMRIHPLTGKREMHAALDITSDDKDNTNIAAMRSGTVLYAGYFGEGEGNGIMVLDDNGEINFYGHLKSGSFHHIRPGERIRQGQLIGVMGETGSATAPHVHITIRRLDENAHLQSAMAQAQSVSIPGASVQPVSDGMRIADPALDWKLYARIEPAIEGHTYAKDAPVPAPPREVLMRGNPLPRVDDFFPPEIATDVPSPRMPVVPTQAVPTRLELDLRVGQGDSSSASGVPRR